MFCFLWSQANDLKCFAVDWKPRSFAQLFSFKWDLKM